MAIYDHPQTKQPTASKGRPDFAAISRRAVARNREALAILEAHDREDGSRAQPSQPAASRRTG